MKYKTVIKIGDDVDKRLKELKRDLGLQSHNKVLRHVLGLSGDGQSDELVMIDGDGHVVKKGTAKRKLARAS